MLFSHVLHFLPLDHKLNQLSYLCRHLTPLSLIAFHHSHLQLSVAAIASRPRHLLVPPSALGVHSLTFDLSLRHRDDASSYASLMQLLMPPAQSVISRFSALRQLALHLHSYNTTSHSSLLSTLIPSSAAFPQLERLTLWNDDASAALPGHDSRPDFCLELFALSRLPSLRYVTLCLPLYVDDYADVFTLPGIHSISLCNPPLRRQLLMPPSVLLSLPSLLSPFCRTLQLPELNHAQPGTDTALGPPNRSSPDAVRQVMDTIRQQAAGRADGLEYLSITAGPGDHAVLLAPAFPSLTALRIDTMPFPHDYAVVLPLLADRPLFQHFDVAIGEWPDRPAWEQFLSRAGPRIRTAHMRNLLNLPNARLIPGVVTEWVDMLLQHCTQLESLQLAMARSLHDSCRSATNSTSASRLSNAALSSLARLHTLGLWGVQLDNEQVAAMVEACPLLEDCTLKTPSVNAGMLAVLGRCCPLLRRVWLEGQGGELLGEQAAASLLAAMQPPPSTAAREAGTGWFSHLRVLYIDWTAGHYRTSSSASYGPKFTNYDPTTAPHSPLFPISHRLIGLLPSLLAAAPLRYLHLPLLHESSLQLLLFEPLRQLRALSLIGRMSAGFEKCTQPNPAAARQQQVGAGVEVVGDEGWWEKASDRMASETRMVKAWQRVFRDVADGSSCDGRADFFDRLQKDLEWDDED